MSSSSTRRRITGACVCSGLCSPWVGAEAMCLEPYFLDGPRRAEFLHRLDDVGAAVESGIDGWARAE